MVLSKFSVIYIDASEHRETIFGTGEKLGMSKRVILLCITCS